MNITANSSTVGKTSTSNSVLNAELRRQIVDLVVRGNDGHIPSSLSIVDMLDWLYRDVLKYKSDNPGWDERDYFILSKAHGCAALYVVLQKYGIIEKSSLDTYCKPTGILGELPDCTKIPGVEASTGSLGHGLSFALGIVLGLRIKQRNNRVFVLVGDGECHEGTVWEAAHVAANYRFGNLCGIVDFNKSGMQLLPQDDLEGKWKAFGWNTCVVDGHDEQSFKSALDKIDFKPEGKPTAIVANTIKGKGVPMLEGDGEWHHRIPDPQEYALIMEALR